ARPSHRSVRARPRRFDVARLGLRQRTDAAAGRQDPGPAAGLEHPELRPGGARVQGSGGMERAAGGAAARDDDRDRTGGGLDLPLPTHRAAAGDADGARRSCRGTRGRGAHARSHLRRDQAGAASGGRASRGRGAGHRDRRRAAAHRALDPRLRLRRGGRRRRDRPGRGLQARRRGGVPPARALLADPGPAPL
ncbi:MAG: hypothetical protein AVDCRST_MAG53-1335, partial [uncultured Solirubrobacteraceae bacterium]